MVDKYGSHLIAKIINNGSGSNGLVAGVNLKYLIFINWIIVYIEIIKSQNKYIYFVDICLNIN